MQHSKPVHSSPIAFAIIAAITLVAGVFARGDEVTLKDHAWTVVFDKQSGALVRLESHKTGWKIETRPQLGVSFRLNAPIDQHDNFMFGRDQKAVEVAKISPHEVRLQWKDLASQKAGVLPITLTATVTLNGDALTFDSKVQNDSSIMVSTLDYPYFGNFNPPSRGERMWTEHMWYANLQDGNIPGSPIMSRQSLFCLVQST
ncbi:MAG: hypothetical protein ACREE6_18275, partial [Limisphaerales bacterium]